MAVKAAEISIFKWEGTDKKGAKIKGDTLQVMAAKYANGDLAQVVN